MERLGGIARSEMRFAQASGKVFLVGRLLVVGDGIGLWILLDAERTTSVSKGQFLCQRIIIQTCAML